jgi:Fe-S cluster assembly protein SufD
MAQTTAVYETYVQQFRELEREFPVPPWLEELRRDALGRFLDRGFPTARRGNEPWKYTDVAPIARATFRYPARHQASLHLGDLRRRLPWPPGWAKVVFLGGRYRPDLSHPPQPGDGVLFLPLAQALAERGELLEEHLGRQAVYLDDAFTALNTAFLRDGAVVIVPDGVEAERTLHLIFVSPLEEEATASYPRVLVLLGRQSRLRLVESYIGLRPGPYLTDAVSEVVLQDGASLEHYRLLLEGEQAYHIGMGRFYQGRDTNLLSVFFGQGCGIARNDVRVVLDAPGSSAYLHGLYVTDGRQHLDNYINIDHIKPHCTSRLFYRGILDGQSHAIFGGTVYVRPDAVKTDAEQEDKNLLLSREAEVDSKPALEIYCDDVKCGHGAAAGAVADEALFYMRSRGLDERMASILLIRGFAAAVLDEVRLPSLRSFLEKQVVRSLPRLRGEGD